jgi:cell division protein FtsZ
VNARSAYNSGGVTKVVRASRKGRTIRKNEGVAPSAKKGKTFAEKTVAQSNPISVTVAQDEFAFGERNDRGHFDHTERNLFEGQDLDLPTYLRKGIKISL